MTPRGYLSYTQKSTWKRSPKAYLERYLYNGASFISREMAFGKRMAVASEDETEDIDPILNQVVAKLPKLDTPELPLNAELKCGQGKETIPLYAKLDHAKNDLTAFKEYKTGKVKWTQRRADEDPQLTFYATMIFILTQKIPEIELVWVPTYEDPDAPGGIACTGEIVTFRTRRSMSQIITEMADMRKVWKEIEEACEQEML